jgi:FkbM family methyltransferase
MNHKLGLAFNILKKYKNGYQFILEKAGFKSKGPTVIYKLRDGMEYKCRVGTSDFAILNEITIMKEYDYYFPKLNENCLVIDFGGQAGSFACRVAFLKKCRVITFEPDNENFKLLEQNIALNKNKKMISAVKAAISQTSGMRTFYLSDHANKGVHSFHYIGPIPVQVKCLDLQDVLKISDYHRIDLLKMDIEGEEHELIDTKNIKFFNKVSRMVLEYHCQSHVQNRQPLESLITKIKSLGFEIDKQVGTLELGLIYASKK